MRYEGWWRGAVPQVWEQERCAHSLLPTGVVAPLPPQVISESVAHNGENKSLDCTKALPFVSSAVRLECCESRDGVRHGVRHGWYSFFYNGIYFQNVLPSREWRVINEQSGAKKMMWKNWDAESNSCWRETWIGNLFIIINRLAFGLKTDPNVCWSLILGTLKCFVDFGAPCGRK